MFLFSPAQKKKRRRNRWSSGFLAKKKSTSSPHTSRDDSHLGSDDEDDGDDGEDVEKGGGTTFNKGAGDKKEQNVADREGPAPREQEESEENKVLTKTGNENNDSIQLNTSQESHKGIETDTQASPSTGKSGKTNSQKQTETDSNEVIMEEAQQSSYAEPMEGEAAESMTPGTSKVVKGDDTGKGWMFTSSSAYSLIFILHCKGNTIYNLDSHQESDVKLLEIAIKNTVFYSECIRCVFFFDGLNSDYLWSFRAECKVHDSGIKECCDAAAGIQCG